MIVNDRLSDLFSIEAILSDLNANIVRATSGPEALRYLLNMEVAVIILDINMPEMDGFETARLIRQREQTSHTPIIFVTAYAKSELDIKRGYELGAVDYLFIPIDPNVLRSKIVALIDLFNTARIVQQ
ncbi:response regulator [Candidatus Desantisbacteria bacterium]|nr:response regulator [Candidatus Desantisbacteria bacterium]